MATSPTEIINPSEFNPSEWITSKEAQELTGYARNTILDAARRGDISSVRRGNMLFYRREEVVKYLNAMKSLGSQKHVPKIHRKSEDIPQTA